MKEQESATTCEVRFIPAPSLRRVLCAGLFGRKAEPAAAGSATGVRLEEQEG